LTTRENFIKIKIGNPDPPELVMLTRFTKNSPKIGRILEK